MKLYPGDRHELLNEIDRDAVTKDITDWLNGQTKSSHVKKCRRGRLRKVRRTCHFRQTALLYFVILVDVSNFKIPRLLVLIFSVVKSKITV